MYCKPVYYRDMFIIINKRYKNNQIKTGTEIVVTDLDLKFGSQNEFLPSGNYWSKSKIRPIRLSMYGQNKMEYDGFVATIGANLDIIEKSGTWYSFQSNRMGQGREKAKTYLLDNPNVAKEIELLIIEKINKKNNVKEVVTK